MAQGSAFTKLFTIRMNKAAVTEKQQNSEKISEQEEKIAEML